MRSDEELLAAFESSALAPEEFRHAEHVRVAWLCLRRAPLIGALARFTDGLKRLAASFGKPELYHETITWAYLFLINQRLGPPDEPWAEFAARNPDLFSTVLAAYYRDEILRSPLARRTFVLPDPAHVPAR
jgi:hypothetical protein